MRACVHPAAWSLRGGVGGECRGFLPWRHSVATVLLQSPLPPKFLHGVLHGWGAAAGDGHGDLPLMHRVLPGQGQEFPLLVRQRGTADHVPHLGDDLRGDLDVLLNGPRG